MNLRKARTGIFPSSFRLPTVRSKDVKNFLDEATLNHDSMLSFEEFVMMMKRLFDKGINENYTRIITKEGKGLIRLNSKETTESMAY